MNIHLMQYYEIFGGYFAIDSGVVTIQSFNTTMNFKICLCFF